MWSRAELKYRAKDALRGHYWAAFLVALVFELIVSPPTFSIPNLKIEIPVEVFENISIQVSAPSLLAPMLYFILGNALIAFLLMMLLQVFLFLPLGVGYHRYFLSGAQSCGSIQDILFPFTSGCWFNTVCAMLLQSIYIFLWSLLLLIPGIVKSYAYAMVPYLLAENPSLSPSRAIQLSKEMTHGYKADMFVLDLSFWGWYLLGMLACGIGILFVHPYYRATHAQLYLVLRAQALEQGILMEEELTPPR